MPYSNCKVLGPYKRPDGRQHMVITYPEGNKSTVSYPKYYMECKLGRLLQFHEVVHHIDEDPTNDSPDNFEVIDRASHGKNHHSIHIDGNMPCAKCGKDVWRTVDQKRSLVRNKTKSGPYCKGCKPVNQYTNSSAQLGECIGSIHD